MKELNTRLPKWILVVSGIFALMELAVGLLLWFSPQSMAETIDLNAKGAGYLVQIWAVRQFALGVIFAYACWNRSAAMLKMAYLFFLVMFAGDLLIGLLQKENSLIISAALMCLVSAIMLYLTGMKDKSTIKTHSLEQTASGI